jgi:hypothetical protein
VSKRFLAALLLVPAALAQQPLHPVCGACHTTVAEDFRTHKHLAAGLDCSTCHGESLRHREAAGAAEVDRIAAPHQLAELCGSCHIEEAKSFLASRHGQLVQAMERGPNCGTCHDVHRVRSILAMKRRCGNCHQDRPQACAAQPAEAKFQLDCANCHTPHQFHR